MGDRTDVLSKTKSLWQEGMRVLEYNKPLPHTNTNTNMETHLQLGTTRLPSYSYSKDLPMPNFDVRPYKMLNFIACLSTTDDRMRYLNYNSNGYNIIPTLVFAEIEEQNGTYQGIVNVDPMQFGTGNDKFSFLQKLDRQLPYKLAIRMQNHMQHSDDARKLLKYAEYKLNSMSSQSNDLERCFDEIARELQARGGSGFKA